tara:strand:- start:422 stop:661 length:240 start_codon:yes stop_codon:yes gene_type:complete
MRKMRINSLAIGLLNGLYRGKLKKQTMKLQTSFSVPKEDMGDIGRKHEAVKRGMTAIASYWERECGSNPSSPACLIFDE